MNTPRRQDDRAFDQIRPITITYDIYGYADASLLFEQGDTKVLVGITLQMGVPHFLKGQRTGWLSAEYAMLPTATQQRTQRETSQAQRNARSVEISRLIGRCLRTTIDLDVLGERTITIDCDVLQADGGTRVASITAASIALQLAEKRWLTAKIIEKNIIKEHVAALSTGMVKGAALADLSYIEDSQAEADFNFIMTKSGGLIEVQGTSEKKPTSLQLFDQLKNLAVTGIETLFTTCSKFPLPTEQQQSDITFQSKQMQPRQQEKQAFFSLASRLK
jgi:ribonuclease PH